MKQTDWKDTLASFKEKITEKEIVTNELLTVGAILYMQMDHSDGLKLIDGYSTRNKYFIIIGFTVEGNVIGSVLLNSCIDPSKYSTEYIKCQYPLKQKDYPHILEYDSYIDCSEIFVFPKERLLNEARFKQNLTQTDLELIINFLKETEVHSTKEKKKFGILL